MFTINCKRIYKIFRKEIIFSLRDSDLLLFILVLPFLIYPIMAVLSVTVASQSQQVVSQAEVRAILPSELERFAERIATTTLKLTFAPDPMQLIEELQQDKTDAIVEVATPSADFFKAESSETIGLKIHYDRTRWKSDKAEEMLTDALLEIKKDLGLLRLEHKKLPESFLTPLRVFSRNIAKPAKMGGFYIGQLLPGLIIMFAVMGAFMSSLDLTAGERDRGTLETLLLSPVPLKELMLGKLTAITGIIMISVSVNLSCMAIMAKVLSWQIGAEMATKISLEASFSALLQVFLLMIPFSFGMSTLFMTIAFMAGTIKKAQMYLSPMMGFIIIPSFVGMVSGFDLSPVTAAIPVLNLALTFKAIFMGTCTNSLYLLTMIFSSFHCLLIVLLASSVYRSEDVLVSESGSLANLLHPAAPGQTAPTARAAVYMFGLAFLLLVAGSSFFQKPELFSMITGLGLTQLLFYLTPPLLYLRFYRYQIIASLDLDLHKIRLENFLLIPVMTLCVLVFVLQFSIWQTRFMPEPKELSSMFAGLFTSAPLWWILLIISPLAGICEEVLFRGFIQKGLRTRLGPWAALVIASMMFGFAHLSPARMGTTFLLGLWMGYIYQITGSLWFSIATHAFNNALAGSVLYFAYTMGAKDASGASLPTMPLPLLLFAILVFTLLIPRFIAINRQTQPQN